MAKRSDRFVVAYPGKDQVVYGRDKANGCSSFIEPMNLMEARRYAEEVMVNNGAVVYELVQRSEAQRRRGNTRS